ERLTRALAALEDEIRLRDSAEAGREASEESNRAKAAATPRRDRPQSAADAAAAGAVRQSDESDQPRAQRGPSLSRRLFYLPAIVGAILLTGGLIFGEWWLRPGNVQAVQSEAPAAASNLAAQAPLAPPSKATPQPEKAVNAAAPQSKAGDLSAATGQS